MRSSVLILLALLIARPSSALAFRKNDRIAFYGDSNTQLGTYPKEIENFYKLRHPELALEFINAGQSGDCISVGYYWRLDAQALSKKPNVLFILFGINDINWGREVNQDYFDVFLDHLHLTVQRALESGVRDVYVLSYPVTDNPKYGVDPFLVYKIPEVSEADDSLLQLLGDQSIDLAKRTCVNGNCGKGIDIERPMRAVLKLTRESNIRLHKKDGVHLNKLGNKVLAGLILQGLGEYK